jgi:hypothetical protein
MNDNKRSDSHKITKALNDTKTICEKLVFLVAKKSPVA